MEMSLDRDSFQAGPRRSFSLTHIGGDERQLGANTRFDSERTGHMDGIQSANTMLLDQLFRGIEKSRSDDYQFPFLSVDIQASKRTFESFLSDISRGKLAFENRFDFDRRNP